MRIFIMEDYAAMSRKAVELMAAQILLHPDSVLGLATSSTPVGLYRCLVERFKAGELDFSGVKSVNLDEYLGLPAENSQSYRYFMNRNLFQHVNINMANTHVPDGLTADPEAECVRYDELIRRMGGIDMQLLGIGSNGHIGSMSRRTASLWGRTAWTWRRVPFGPTPDFFPNPDRCRGRR